MHNWRDFIKPNDIQRAAKAAGVHRENYNLSRKLAPSEWTDAMVKINYELKRIVTDREEKRQVFIDEQIGLSC